MTRLLISLFCLGLMAASPVMSQDTPLSAAQSDPETLGWMQGFPPPADRIIRMTDADAFTFPKLRWTMCNFRELTPTKAVRNGTDGADKLPVALDPGIDAVNFTPMGSDRKMTWDQAFDVNYTDGILVLHRGRIVYERYGGCMDENSLHGVMSVSKSLTGLVAETLVAEGALDETALMRDVIPELDGSGFGDATVRQVLEMTTALDYSEDYADPNSDVWTYSRASSPLPPPEGYEGPRSYFGYLQTVRKSGAHGEAFAYRTINADAVGWLIARVSGQDVADWVSQNIWSHIGAEREAFFTVDFIGTPFAGAVSMSRCAIWPGWVSWCWIGAIGRGNRSFRRRPSTASGRAATRRPSPAPDMTPCRGGAIAACGGSAMTITAPLPRAAFMGKRSGSTLQHKWLSYGSPRTLWRRMRRMTRHRCPPIARWRIT